MTVFVKRADAGLIKNKETGEWKFYWTSVDSKRKFGVKMKSRLMVALLKSATAENLAEQVNHYIQDLHDDLIDIKYDSLHRPEDEAKSLFMAYIHHWGNIDEESQKSN